mmetsp:Transcript_12090/g.18649  ORF Transcript_12090/g.18649 Transcript_12090/m.18649 type:complete len:505 (+) Transcript_12090:127-1641(+)
MASIPYDPTLVLGNIVDLERIEVLMQQAEAQKPQVQANDKLNTLLLSSYKMEMIYNQMISMGVSREVLVELSEEKEKLKEDMADAAIELGEATIEAEEAVAQIKMAAAQQKIGLYVESPLNYQQSKVKKFPLSFDSLKFDVQYFRREENEDKNNAHSQSMSRYVGATMSALGVTASASASIATQKMSQSAMSRHDIEGTIVITASCTHQQADIMTPTVLNPKKALKAWNATFPKDKLKTDPSAMFDAATAPSVSDENVIHLLSGCTKGSSFVGYVHIHQIEQTESSQEAESLASSIETSVKASMGIAAMSGSYGLDASTSNNAKSLLSTSQVENQCSFVVMGCIPTIECDKITTTVEHLTPDAQEVMGQLAALQGDKDAGGDDGGMDGAVGEGKKGAQFQKLNNAHLDNAVSAVAKYQNDQNSVISTNTMMTAFEDYLKKCMDPSPENSCGIPINFYIKEINKADVAKCYIQSYYPNGASTKQALRGQLGQKPEADGGGGGDNN